MKVPVKILFIRRDNIGDLICTTPTIRAVRQRYPDARIDILVNSYNAEAIRTNPDINEVHIYRKGKHFPEESPLEVFWSNLKVIWRLRRQHYDFAIACGSFTPTLQRFTRMCAAARSVGFVSAETGRASYTDPIPLPPAGEHEVDRVFRLLLPLGVSGDPGPLLLFPDPAETTRFEEFYRTAACNRSKPLLALSISARQRKRWVPEKFIELIARLREMCVDTLLLWAPGSEDNPTFPGDDEVAAKIVSASGDGLLAYPAKTIPALTAALAAADAVITLDGGSLHMAAALGKPIVALMPAQNISSWYPWQVENIVLSASAGVTAIEVDEVASAAQRLLDRVVKSR